MQSGKSNGLAAVGVAMGLAMGVAGGPAALADVIHVDAGAPGGGDGASWETAYDNLHAALEAAGAGDEIWVVANVYVPSGPREASFRLRSGVGVYGGFAGDETSRAQRDWLANETVLSGDRAGDDGPHFENYDDNSLHVLDASGTGGAALDGFTIRGGHANGEVHVDRLGAGLLAAAGSVSIRHCIFRDNFADIDGAGVFAEHSGSIEIDDCAFVENLAIVGAGLHTDDIESVTVTGTTFTDNTALAGGGGVFCVYGTSVVFVDCDFRGNLGGYGQGGSGGGLLIGLGTGAVVTDCFFADNRAGFNGGGANLADALVINCVFSRNEASQGGGLATSNEVSVFNSSFGQNLGNAIAGDGTAQVEVVNSILWGSDPGPIEMLGTISIAYSNVEGGWPGVGNIDADPLFVQPGTDDLRLGFGSPCVDAGLNEALPEGVDLDIDGNPRIQNGIVDMGAYEGEFEQEPGGAENEDVDDGEAVLLVPNGGGFDPESNLLVIFTNRSGEDGASVSVTEYEGDRHPGARGFLALGATAELVTSIDDGGFLAQVFIPFDEADLGGADPRDVDLTYYDAGVDNWALAVGRNVGRSPGHRGAIGDRVVREGPAPWGVTRDVGDYGVYFDTETRRGFVWANVDHAADFSHGFALCPADTRQPPDSRVDFDDILAVLDNWGAGAGPFDVNGDGVVDADDLFLVLAGWGACD